MAINTINGDSGSATGTVVTLTGATSGAVFTAATSTITQSFDYLSLPSTTSTNGQVTINGVRFLHNYGDSTNTFAGGNAGNFTTTSTGLTGIGNNSLNAISSTSNNNTAFEIPVEAT